MYSPLGTPSAGRGLRGSPRFAICFLRSLCLLLLLCLARSAFAQNGPPPAPHPPQALDANVTVFTFGPGQPDKIGIGYNKDTSRAEIEKDLAKLASLAGQAAPSAKITPAKKAGGITLVDAEMSGLTNWSTGEINIDAVAETFRRFGHFRVVVLWFGKFPLKPVEPIERGPLKIHPQASPSSVLYDIWLDQAQARGALPKVYARPAWWQSQAFLWGLTLLVLLLAGLGIALVARAQHRAPVAQHRES